ncbi:O-antigen ligase family protein [Bacillus cereus]|uniref:O-antigen ligase family protein n=1 Tax=Bacillus cereus TaxID=1396 RepID=UPI000BF2F7F2|nr:O-antigen ligase family protein [Bacillus cereus]PER82241.1 sugar isomerase [Bacillus cereus]
MEKSISSTEVEKVSSKIISMLLGTFIICAMFNNSAIPILSKLGFFGLLSIFGMGLFFLLSLLTINFKVDSRKGYIYIIFILFIFSSLLSLLDHPSSKGVYIFIELLLINILFIFLTIYNLAENIIKHISILGMLYVLICYILDVSTNGRMSNILYINPNTLGAIVLYLYIFFMFRMNYYKQRRIRSLYFFCVSFLSIFLIFYSQARSIWISLTVFFVTYYMWDFLYKRKIFSRMYICIILAFCMLFSFFYPRLPEYDFALDWNRELLELTGKSLFSGRQLVWKDLLNSAMENPLLGYSFDMRFNGGMSAHNMYLEIILQSGILGLGFLLILFYSIWLYLCRYGHYVNARISGAALTAIIIHQLFEVTLIQNNLAIGIMQWIIISLGFSGNLIQKKYIKGVKE